MQINDLISEENRNIINLSHYPSAKILLLAICGMLINILLHLQLFVILTIVILYLVFVITFRNKYIFSKFIIGGILIGICLGWRIDNSELNIPDKTIPDMPAIVSGEIVKIITLNNNRAKLIINGKIDTKALEQISNTNIILDIYKMDSIKPDIELGYELYAPVKARLPKHKYLTDDFDEQFYAQFNNVNWFVSTAAKNVKITKYKTTFSNIIEPVVKSIKHQIEIVFPSNCQAIINALITGDKSDLSSELKQAYSFTGTAHVLAVSGLHVGIISSIFALFLSYFDNRKIKFVIFSILIIIYIIITGAQPSVIRAGIMAICVYYAYILERVINPINILSFVVLMFIIFDPLIIYSPGFQMSVSSVFGILFCYSTFSKTLTKLIGEKTGFQKYLANSFAVTFSASLIVTPIVAYYFKVYSIISPISNLLIVPLISLAMIFAFISLFLSFIYLPLGQFYGYSTDFLINISNQINIFVSKLPFTYILSDRAVYISVLISIFLLYIFISKNKKMLYFRIIISILIISIVSHLLPASTKIGTQIIPYKDCVLLKHNIDASASFYWIADRKPNNYSAPEFGIYKHLLNSDKNLIIAINGNIGLATIDKLKLEKRIKVIELNMSSQKRLEKYFGLKTSIAQIVEKEILWH